MGQRMGQRMGLRRSWRSTVGGFSVVAVLGLVTFPGSAGGHPVQAPEPTVPTEPTEPTEPGQPAASEAPPEDPGPGQPVEEPSGTPAVTGDSAAVLSPDLTVRELAPGIWLHTSWRTYEGDRFPSHGLLVDSDDGLWWVDTAWGEEPTELLLTWVEEELERPIRGAVVTHFHDDRLGGAAVLADREIPVAALADTRRRLAGREGAAAAKALTETFELAVGESRSLGPLEIFYPGPGHTPDNLMVWLPAAKVLFGGCAVRPAESTGPGNTADADLAAWPGSVGRALEQVRRWTEGAADRASAVVVVPSHGEVGGPELLEHTREIVERGEGR